jgi:hypothetical protein
MYRIKKRDNHVEYYIGTDYDIGQPENVGQLRGALEQILDDMKELDDNLKVSEVCMRETTLYFTLEEGIVQ